MDKANITVTMPVEANEFVEKLISKLEEKAFSVQLKQGVKHPSTLEAMMEKFSVLEIKELINQLVEFYHIHCEQEYMKGYEDARKNNGWIPCSEKLPNISTSYLVTKICDNDGDPIYETSHEIFWTKDNKWDCERDEDCEWKVIAWREKLAPYQLKGE